MQNNCQQAANTLSCDLKPMHFTLQCIRMVCVWPRALQMHPVRTSHSIKRLNRFECNMNVCFSLRARWVSCVEGRGVQRCTSTVVCSNHAHRLPERVLNERKAHVHISSCVCTRRLICMLRNMQMPAGQRCSLGSPSTEGPTMSHSCGRQ